MTTIPLRQRAQELDDVTIVVLGASGDLARRKIYPAIFELYRDGYLSDRFRVVGFARTVMDIDDFTQRLRPFIKIKDTGQTQASKGGSSGKSSNLSERERLDKFLTKMHYISGNYDSAEDYQALNTQLQQMEEADYGESEGNKNRRHHRMFFLSLPPDIFLIASKLLGQYCRTSCGWNRIVLEKPFGRDLDTFEELTGGLNEVYRPQEIYRIDHYIGKEIVQNLLALRFANVIFDPLWNRNNVKCIQIIFKETLGVEGRGGYFDRYGMIRDVMQNHLMQVLALVCMEPPVSLEPEDIRAEKVKVLKSFAPIDKRDVVIGQYTGRKLGDKVYPGYTEDPSVPNDSMTPTFASCVLKIRNRRWDGVPILMKAGKALDEKVSEIRIQFNDVPANLYEKSRIASNELVIRISPEESIFFSIMNKVPGLTDRLAENQLDFTYKSRFGETRIPDAYSRLFLNILEGDESNFISEEELRQSWKIWTPVLDYIESSHVIPERYDSTSRGPVESEYLAAKYDLKWLA